MQRARLLENQQSPPRLCGRRLPRIAEVEAAIRGHIANRLRTVGEQFMRTTCQSTVLLNIQLLPAHKNN